MPDNIVRWPDRPDRPVTPGHVAVVTVSFNTRELTALLLCSLRRILEWEPLEVIIVDNGSKDGSAELLAGIAAAGGCRLVANAANRMHGPALTQAMSFLAARESDLPEWVWILDSDVVVSRPDALKKALERAGETTAAIVGESWWDSWHHYVIHRGRSSLMTVWESGDTTHPDYWWALEHHEPHFGLVDGAAASHEELLRRFRAEVGSLDDPTAIDVLSGQA